MWRSGGGAGLDDNGDLNGAPELVVEISASRASYDLHDKKHAYERNGIKEYLVWRTCDRAIEGFFWNDGQYEPLAPDADGCLRSREFPGLWLNVAAILAGDRAAAPRSLQAGLDRLA